MESKLGKQKGPSSLSPRDCRPLPPRGSRPRAEPSVRDAAGAAESSEAVVGASLPSARLLVSSPFAEPSGASLWSGGAQNENPFWRLSTAFLRSGGAGWASPAVASLVRRESLGGPNRSSTASCPFVLSAVRLAERDSMRRCKSARILSSGIRLASLYLGGRGRVPPRPSRSSVAIAGIPLLVDGGGGFQPPGSSSKSSPRAPSARPACWGLARSCYEGRFLRGLLDKPGKVVVTKHGASPKANGL